METVAAKLPKSLVDAVDRLVSGGRFANRSEVFRTAVREFLEAKRGGAEKSPSDPRAKTLRELSHDPRYRNRFVALHGTRVVDTDDELSALVRRVLERPEHPVHIERASAMGGSMEVRMPGVRVRR